MRDRAGGGETLGRPALLANTYNHEQAKTQLFAGN